MPPLVGVAVKVTFVPVHTVLPGAAAMLTDGVIELTVIVISLDMAVVGLAQDALLVITQVILSPLTRVEF